MRSSLRRALPVAITGVLLAACTPDVTGVADPASPVLHGAATLPALLHPGPQMVANELLVRFLPGATGPARSRALARVRGTVAEHIVTVAMHQAGDAEGVTLVRTPLPPLQAVAAIAGDSTVEYAEPNWIYQADAVADDPYFTDGSLWGMTGQYGSGASAAWAQDRVGSASVAVGIIDEGYMYTHEDLAANAGTNPGEIAGNRVDDDGNGLVDDVWGWDFDGGNSSVFDGVADDHGTHVAGTIGAVGGNGVGVAGMVWQVRLLGAKFLGTRGGTTANAIKAVDYFTALKTRGSNPVNIVATNNSWGGGGYSQALRDAITRAGAANILFVAAAGNSGVNCDLFPCYPAAYTNANVIAVAALTSSGARASFSNYGGTTVDLGAPGSGIWSTVPLKAKRGTASGYAAYSGTSMATPHVTGAVALYAALHPGATAAQVKAAILGATVPTASMAGATVTGGRLSVSGF
jgi:subtilisin family serine protease